MPEIKIKAELYNIRPVRDSFTRRSVQFTNLILEKFRKIGLGENDVELSEERFAIKRAPASASWWVDNSHCHFSYNKMPKYVDNLQVVLRVIERQVDKVLTEEISVAEFINMFKEDDDFNKKRDAAREFFGLDEDHIDLESITKQYKILAKKLHPDMPEGNLDKFKELNAHHKILKRELE